MAFRRHVVAKIGGIGAARREQAADRTVKLPRHNTRYRRQPTRMGTFGKCRQQGGGIGVMRIGEEVAHRALFDFLAGILHADAFRRFGDDTHGMGNQHQGHAGFTLKLEKEVENLRLDRDIERSGRFIGNEELGIAGNRHGNHDALVHAPRKLMRIGGETALRRRNADQRQEFDGAPAPGGLIHVEMGFQRFHQLKADGEARIEARHRLLEDHGEVLAGDGAALARRHGQEVTTVEGHLFGRHFRSPGQKPHDGQHGNRLARAGFADYCQDFALVDRKRHPIDGAKAAAGCGEFDGQIFNFEERHDGLLFFGVLVAYIRGSLLSRNARAQWLPDRSIRFRKNAGDFRTGAIEQGYGPVLILGQVDA